MLALFFEDGIESFEILHTKHANFKLGVQYLLKETA